MVLPLLLSHHDKGGKFTPASISGLVLDADPSQLTFQDAAKTTAAGVGDPLGAVGDASGSGNDFLQSTADNRPTLQEVTNNGKTFRVIRGDGTNDFMQSSLGGQSTYFGVIVSIKRSAPSTTNRLLLRRHANHSIFTNTTVPTNTDWQFYDPTTHLGGDPEAWGCIELHMASVASLEVYLNGALAAMINPHDGIATATETCILGNTTGGSPGDHDIARVLIYNNVPSAGNIALLRAYIEEQYGVPF